MKNIITLIFFYLLFASCVVLFYFAKYYVGSRNFIIGRGRDIARAFIPLNQNFNKRVSMNMLDHQGQNYQFIKARAKRGPSFFQ